MSARILALTYPGALAQPCLSCRPLTCHLSSTAHTPCTPPPRALTCPVCLLCVVHSMSAPQYSMVEYVLKSPAEGTRLEITQPPPKFELTTFHPSQVRTAPTLPPRRHRHRPDVTATAAATATASCCRPHRRAETRASPVQPPCHCVPCDAHMACATPARPSLAPLAHRTGRWRHVLPRGRQIRSPSEHGMTRCWARTRRLTMRWPSTMNACSPCCSSGRATSRSGCARSLDCPRCTAQRTRMRTPAAHAHAHPQRTQGREGSAQNRLHAKRDHRCQPARLSSILLHVFSLYSHSPLPSPPSPPVSHATRGSVRPPSLYLLSRRHDPRSGDSVGAGALQRFAAHALRARGADPPQEVVPRCRRSAARVRTRLPEGRTGAGRGASFGAAGPKYSCCNRPVATVLLQPCLH